ncbi:MAG: hypothetical protein RLZZ501_348 [Pseudomonadota bacterium]
MPADLFGVPANPRSSIQPRGYFQRPGSGPTDQTCATCRHALRHGRYAKCGRARGIWTRSRGSDILLRAPACAGWEAPDAA